MVELWLWKYNVCFITKKTTVWKPGKTLIHQCDSHTHYRACNPFSKDSSPAACKYLQRELIFSKWMIFSSALSYSFWRQWKISHWTLVEALKCRRKVSRYPCKYPQKWLKATIKIILSQEMGSEISEKAVTSPGGPVTLGSVWLWLEQLNFSGNESFRVPT